MENRSGRQRTVTPEPNQVRVDSWLWAARLSATRSVAAHACVGGHVTINGRRAKAASLVHVGDEVRLRLLDQERIAIVRVLGTKRVSASDARTWYEERTPPRPQPQEEPATVVRERGAGRPTKRDRRALERLRGRPSDPTSR